MNQFQQIRLFLNYSPCSSLPLVYGSILSMAESTYIPGTLVLSWVLAITRTLAVAWMAPDFGSNFPTDSLHSTEHSYKIPVLSRLRGAL